MRLIARCILPTETPSVYVQGEITQHKVDLKPLEPGRMHHLYVSPHNHGAAALGEELPDVFRRDVSVLPTAGLDCSQHARQ